MAKLNPALVLEMRSKYASGDFTIEQLAREYHVSWNSARSAIKGTSYQNVEMTTVDAPAAALAESERRLLELIGSNPMPQPEEDPLDEILRRRGSAIIEENGDEPTE